MFVRKNGYIKFSMSQEEIINWIERHRATLVYTGTRWRLGITVEVSPYVFQHLEGYGRTPSEAVAAIEAKQAEIV